MRWLPLVPEHWNEQRAKTFFREVDERSKTGQEELLSVSHLTGITPRSQKNVTMFKAASYIGSKLCRPGDIVVNTLWAWMAALGTSRHTGIISPAYGVYRPHNADNFNPTYLDYLLRTRAYVAEYTGRSTGIRSSRLRLYPNQFLDIALLQPPRPEQDQIVAYLRAQDAHIARFIKAKRELIGLLTEQKLRIIDHAVTRGLDASVKLKSSGVEWLGEVPEHWEVIPLRRVLRVKSGDMIHASEETEIGYPIYGGNGRRGFTKKSNCEGPMLLIGRVGAKCGCIHRVDGKFWASEHALRVIPLRKIDLGFFEHLLRWIDFNRYAIRTAQPLLNSTIVRSQLCAIPQVEEQQAICRWITAECQPLDEAIARANDEITLIREYRDRLIADAVTGQVDVRGWQPGPDDAVSDTDLAALGDDDAEPADEEDADGDE
ncbi:MAG: restriction endonuclease subunit S [Betaproteobacteria bacterium]|nr:restriction endonuclease subunit S [Betaproteobacteria bacterium]MCL2885913.1 restriction endonuclease subunit S [Betaproteobacteria bacterium]